MIRVPVDELRMVDTCFINAAYHARGHGCSGAEFRVLGGRGVLQCAYTALQGFIPVGYL